MVGLIGVFSSYILNFQFCFLLDPQVQLQACSYMSTKAKAV